MPYNLDTIMNRYIAGVLKIYGPHLKSVILYGSYARGDYNADSDIDIMILLDISDIELKKYSDNLSDLT